MKKLLTMLFLLMAFTVVETVDAKSYGSKSFGSKSYGSKSSNKSTGGWFSSKKSAPAPKKVAPSQSKKTTKGFASSKSTAGKNVTTKSTAPKTTMDKKIAKKNALLSKNNSAGKKYGSKKNAESAYRQKMASKNKYTSPTPPATRPDYIPQSVNGRNVSYSRLSDGGYGYGYTDPITNAFVAVAAANMIADAAHMSRYGYGSYDAHGNPIYRQPIVYRNQTSDVVYRDPLISTGMGVMILIIVLGVFGIVVFIMYKNY